MCLKKILIFIVCFLIAAIPLAATAAPVTAVFKDVNAEHWAKADIAAAAKKGYVSGYPDGTFRPSGTITRAEFTAVIARIAEVPRGTSGNFTDIAGHWAEGAIQSAVASGLIASGDFGAKFEPNTPITRLEMARMMARTLAADDAYDEYLQAFGGLYNGDLPFVDYREIAKADLPLVALTFGARVMGGYPDASFGLEKNATRAEAAVMFNNLAAARAKKPEEAQYLRELKEVAETGMNAEAVSNLIPQVNLFDDPVVAEHPSYTAKLKRVYVVPLDGTVSMYERKFLWDRNEMDERFRTVRGYVVGVVDITPKVNSGSQLYSQSLYITRHAAFDANVPAQKFDFYASYKKVDKKFTKGKTEEIVLYGYYQNDNWYSEFRSQYGTTDLQTFLLKNPDTDKGK